MTMTSTVLSSAIGARVRRERQAREWTLDHLAEVAGISRRQLVNLEQGEANPSIGTLLKISDALGIGLPALVEPPSSKTVKITRAGQGAELWNGEHGGRGVLLVGTASPDVQELWEWELGPGDRHTSESHTTATRELLHVRDGAVTLGVADEVFELEAGDAITFPGDVAHFYANLGADPASFTLAVYEPGMSSATNRKGM